MTDDFDKLEAELARMRPAPASRALARRIGGDLRGPTPASNRLLGAAVFAGAVAAAVIVGVVAGEPVSRFAPDAPSVSAADRPPRPGPGAPDRDLNQAFVVVRLDDAR